MTKSGRLYVFLVVISLLASATLTIPALAEQGAVRVVLFWMDGCPHCHYVLEEVLPPLQEKYGGRLEIRLIEVVTTTDVDQLLQTAASFGIPKEQVGVPFLVVGEHVLIGSQQIPAELPGLIEQYLAQGGLDWPEGLSPQATEITTPLATMGGVPAGANVRAILFTTPDCHDCQLEVEAALTPVRDKYGASFEYRTVDITTSEDVQYLYQVAAQYSVSPEQVDLPLLIIGDKVLVAEQMADELEGWVAYCLEAGGVGWPDLPARLAVVTPSLAPTQQPTVAPLLSSEMERSNGFTLAIAVMVGMAACLVYSVAAFLRGSSWLSALHMGWLDALFVILALAGSGIAGYLAYVETQAVSAVCGPVGDCNAVQNSSYALLFGVLPIGVLGLIGYLALLAGWFYARLRADRLARVAPLVVFGMTFLGVLFSLYLTYLEPFVIRAVCAWCLTSAVIMTLLLLVSLKPAIQVLEASQEGV